MDGQVAYEDTTDFDWTVRAFQSLREGRLHGRVFAADGVLSSHVWGECPRCAHAIDVRQVHTAVVTGPHRAVEPADEPPTLPIDIACRCGSPHEHAPGSATGCGVSFRIELVLP